jgi:hypothetical protein
MISFIQRDDNPEIPPPYKFPGVNIMSFRLQADLGQLQGLCDELLNIGSLADRGFEYRAFTDFVDMEIVTYPKMLFDEPPYSSRGFASQQELYFRFYVWKFISFGGVLFPDVFHPPQLFFPFIYVDNSWSMISGRNVIGFPKVMAQFCPTPVLGVDPLKIKVSALALDKFLPTTELKWHPIVEINPVTSLAAPLPAGGPWPWAGLTTDTPDPILEQLLELFLLALPDDFETVQLKQFRDLPSGACFQAVVNTPFSFAPSSIGAVKPLPAVSITVNEYDSLKIPSSLGLQPNTPLQPLLQYSVSLDMRMDNGSNLFVNG